MKIEIKKISNFKSHYCINRTDGSEEVITLDTKTFLTHDLCHYVVEKRLEFKNGFWGLLSQGYAFKELFGRENELTEELKFVEKVVGPIQSVYMGYFKKEDLSMLIHHIDIEVNIDKVDACLLELGDLTNKWKNMTLGDTLQLDWDL